jgi:hypothetical protein
LFRVSIWQKNLFFEVTIRQKIFALRTLNLKHYLWDFTGKLSH